LPKYSLILSPNISSTTKISVWELCVEGVSVLDPFIKTIEDEGTYEDDLAGALRNLEMAADLLILPKTKFREIKGQNLNGKLFEAKYGAVRIYHFHEKYTGRIIVLGGIKNNQPKDIKLAVKTIKAYQNENK